MTPHFASWQEFLAMGDYGFYVWLSYLISLLVLSWILIMPLFHHRHLQRQAQRLQRRHERQQESALNSHEKRHEKLGDEDESGAP